MQTHHRIKFARSTVEIVTQDDTAFIDGQVVTHRLGPNAARWISDALVVAGHSDAAAEWKRIYSLALAAKPAPNPNADPISRFNLVEVRAELEHRANEIRTIGATKQTKRKEQS